MNDPDSSDAQCDSQTIPNDYEEFRVWIEAPDSLKIDTASGYEYTRAHYSRDSHTKHHDDFLIHLVNWQDKRLIASRLIAAAQ